MNRKHSFPILQLKQNKVKLGINMFSISLSVGSMCFIVLVSAVSPQPTYLEPLQRTEGASISVIKPTSSVEFQIVPSSEYSIATVQPTKLSIMDYVFSPITAVLSLSSTAVSVASWVIINSSLILLGMAIVIGFCALTPFCTLIIEKPSFLARENMSTFPYIEELENFIIEAYNRYHAMQRSD